MRNINLFFFLIFVFVLSNSFFSCSSKKMGFLHNSYPHYAVKDKMQGSSSSKTVVAGSENKVSAHTAPESVNKIENINSKQVFSGAEKKSESKSFKDNFVQKLTKEEKKQVKKDIVKRLKESKRNDSSVSTLLLVIIAILLPPLAVALVDGITGPFWLSILLTLLFYFPGLIYALYRIFRTDID